MFDSDGHLQQAFCNSCDDSFVHAQTTKTYHHLALGQVAEHVDGDYAYISDSIKAILTIENPPSIQDQLTEIIDLLDTKGLCYNIFIGKIDKHLPILYYTALGDISLAIIRNNISIALQSQSLTLSQGCLTHIHYNAIKLQPGDLIVAVSQTIPKIIHSLMLSNIDKTKMQANIASCMSTNQSYLIWHYQGMSNFPESPKINDFVLRQNKQQKVPEVNLASRKPLTLRDTLETRAPKKITSTVLRSEPDIQFCKLPNADTLFYQLNEMEGGRLALRDLCIYMQIPEYISRRLQLLIMETFCSEQIAIPIYVTQHELYVEFPLNMKVSTIFKSLIPSQYIKRVASSDVLCFVFSFTADIDIYAQAHKDMKNRLRLGLSEKEYQQYMAEKEHDQRLLHQTKLAAMGEMVGSIAHQWRQPLNELAMRIQMVPYALHKADDPETYMAKFIEENLTTIDFMSQTIDDFRNFFRRDKTSKTFSVSSLINKTLELLNGLLCNNHIHVEVDTSDELLVGVESELQQVLMNLLSNSIDALKTADITDKSIRITWQKSVLTVQDNGGGISPDLVDRVFEPYFTTKPYGKGTGLGLYMSKLIIEQGFKGQLQIENTDFILHGQSHSQPTQKGACAKIQFD